MDTLAGTIKGIYKALIAIGDRQFKQKMKMFTASLLLKIVHKTFIIFDLNEVSQGIDTRAGIKSSTPVYYYLKDNLNIIQNRCQQREKILRCFQKEIQKA